MLFDILAKSTISKIEDNKTSIDVVAQKIDELTELINKSPVFNNTVDIVGDELPKDNHTEDILDEESGESEIE